MEEVSEADPSQLCTSRLQDEKWSKALGLNWGEIALHGAVATFRGILGCRDLGIRWVGSRDAVECLRRHRTRSCWD